jgi:hypothetical protein
MFKTPVGVRLSALAIGSCFPADQPTAEALRRSAGRGAA